MRKLMISSRRADFEIGARLLAALSFPGATESADRRRAADAWCAGIINCTKAVDPSCAADLEAQYPRYAKLDQRSINKALRRTKSRLRNRQVAGRMTRGYFQEWIDRRPALLPASMARLSINELAKLVRRESGQHDPENTEKRTWRPSKPVLHIASAFDYVSRSRLGENDNGYDLNDGDLHREILRLAEASERVVDGDPRFQVKPEEMLRIRLR